MTVMRRRRGEDPINKKIEDRNPKLDYVLRVKTIEPSSSRSSRAR